MRTILVTSRSFSSGSIDLEGELSRHGYSIRRGPADHRLDALREDLASAEGWIAGTGPVTASHFAAAGNLRILARHGVGFESVDLAAAAFRGVTVTNTPGANSNAVAEHAVALMLTSLRSIPAGNQMVRRHDWSVVRGRELGSLTVGLAGFGRIGQIVARILRGFGAEVYAADPFLPDDEILRRGAVPVSMDDLARVSDVISLHAPGGHCLVDRSWLSNARPGSLLINTARPELIDEAAVCHALSQGILGGFAADTLIGDAAGTESPLLAPGLADRVIVTPHFGAQTVQAVDGMGSMAVRNVLAVLQGGAAPNAVPGPHMVPGKDGR